MRAIAIGLMLMSSSVQAFPNVLNNSAHFAGTINSAITTLLGAGIVEVSMFNDQTNLSSTFTPNMIPLATDTGATNFKIPSGVARNNAPYQVLSNPFSTYTNAIEMQNYAALEAGDIIDNWAYDPTSPLAVNAAPGVYVDAIDVTSDSLSGGGISFAMTPAYKGFDTTTLSSTTSNFGGILGALRHSHPSWSAPDIIAALRQTASNWASGYNPANHGFGAIDYDSATAIGSPAALFLQAPIFSVQMASNRATITLYPYRQTRRVNEVIYLVPSAYVWPVKDEYVLADITAAGGSLVYSSNPVDVIPIATVSLTAYNPGTYKLVAFTSDGAGAFSRVEMFTPQTITLAPCVF